MPLYTYKDRKTGAHSVRMVSIANRDRQPGLERVLEFPTAQLGIAENPHTTEYGVRQGLREMEQHYGRAEIQRQLGPGMSLDQVKRTWSN